MSSNEMQTTTSGVKFTCEKIGYYDIRLIIEYGNGQRYKIDHKREINELRIFAYASVANSALRLYIINNEDADEIYASLTKSNL